jgi:precorrin-2 methylase
MATVSTKSFGTNVVSKTTDSFSINSSAIPHSSTNVTASNVRDAIEEVATQVAVGVSAPTGATVTEGDLWYDTDDDIFYVRRDTSWIELVQEELTGNIDGGTW